VLFLVSCLVLLGAIVLSGGVADAAVVPSARAATAVLTVNQGDSLWSIARRIAPGEDPRGVVMRIRDLNGLAVNGLMPGQRLVVPAWKAS
jgi:Tfp pilus assembly protein FimV